ncbi:hypothetical protein LSTR_LSTR001694 [Laodelphax striatellus]|uniref:Uncharacterized protein n=1 Tax=Laodelphax striatellus TaxID=195883 RepID=A0A482XCL1_LAOST|nr:hypothetical protein LSTR_LSTR001694 [Laodelphax striatellus]
MISLLKKCLEVNFCATWQNNYQVILKNLSNRVIWENINILTSNHEYTTEAGNNNDNSSTEPYLEADLNKELSTPPCNDAMYIQFTNEDKEPLQENHGNDALSLPQLNNLAENIFEIRVTKYMGSKSMSSKIL